MISSHNYLSSFPFYDYNYNRLFLSVHRVLWRIAQKNKQNIEEVENINLFKKLASVTVLIQLY